jgi:hypothetical protein
MIPEKNTDKTASERRNEMHEQVKTFCLHCLRLAEKLPESQVFDRVRKELVDSAIELIKSHRMNRRCSTNQLLLANMQQNILHQERNMLWLEVITELEPSLAQQAMPLWLEADKLISMMVSAHRKVLEKKS